MSRRSARRRGRLHQRAARLHRLERLENRWLLATLTVNPVADNTLYEHATGQLSNGEGVYLFAGKTGGRAARVVRRALVDFDVSSIPAGSTIDNVTLGVHVSKVPLGGPNTTSMDLHKVLASWGEGASDAGSPGGAGTQSATGDATWIHRTFSDVNWSTMGGDFVSTSSASTNFSGIGSYSWTSAQMKADVANWVADPSSAHGWIVVGDESQDKTARRFDSRESTTTSFRPTLQIDFTPPSLTTSIVAASILENAGTAATTGTVTRTPVTATPLVVSLSSDDTTEATVSATLTIPANVASATFDLNAVDDTILDGPQTATITAAATGFSDGIDTVVVADFETLSALIAADSIAENAGPGATTITVTRNNTDISLPLTVTLDSNDPTEATAPATMTIPANQASASVDLTAIDDALLDGTQTVTIRASNSGYQDGTDTADVTDFETLTVVIAATGIAENAVNPATTATVTRSNTDDSAPLVVGLSSSDTTEATVVTQVTIPANQSSVSFDVNAVDDSVLDGTQTVTLTGTNSDYVAVTDTVDVIDFETLTIEIAIATFAENTSNPATTATVTRGNTDRSSALVVNLLSSDTSEVTVPAQITIPANQAAATFDLTAVDDTLLDGTQVVTLTGSEGRYQSVADIVAVTDVETLSISIAAASIAENAGNPATTATVTRGNTDIAAALVVDLSSSDPGEAAVPVQVTIPANQSSAVFDISAVDDSLLDGTQNVTITGTESRYQPGADTVDVTDFETLSIAIAATAVAENATAPATTATVTRGNSDISASLVVNLSSSDLSELSVPNEVTIAANQSSVLFDITAVDDSLLDGTQIVTVSGGEARYESIDDTIDVTDFETLTISIAADAFAEDAANPATTATVTRGNTDRSAELVVTLTSSDTSEATVPSQVTIPANQASATFNLSAVDDTLLDGNQTVTVTGSESRYVSHADTVDVTDVETLSITIAAAAFAENASHPATTASVARGNTDISAALVVNLASSDTSEATVPAQITIPANQSSVVFDITAVDDTLLDGTQPVSIAGSESRYQSGSDTVDVTDFERLFIAIIDDSFAENTSGPATGATVSRGNTDIDSALVVSLVSDDPTELTVPAEVTIPANQTSASFDITAVDDALLDGIQTVTVTGSETRYQAGVDTVDVTDFETLTISITADSFAENAVVPATTATVARSNNDNSSPLVINLTSSDATEATAPAQVTIPANQASVSFDLTAVDDTILDGTQTVTMTGVESRYVSQGDTVDVTDHEQLTVTIAADVFAENVAGPATTATVTRSNTDILAPLVVDLTSSDASEATVPLQVTIPSNQSSVEFDLTAVDDSLLDGTQTVTITGNDPRYQPGTDTVDVTDVETLSLSIAASTIAENAGTSATTATVSRGNTDIGASLVVSLTSDDITELAVPAQVTIPANQSSVDFDISAVDDLLLDGTQNVSVTASEPRYESAAGSVDVTDFETVTLEILSDSVPEDGGAGATTATVTRSDTDTGQALVVTLASNDTGEATVPGTVTIPGNQASVSFDVDAVDDSLLDGTQTVTVTAMATGYQTGFDTFNVTDVERLTLVIADSFVPENAGEKATTATITRHNTDTAAPLELTLASDDISEVTVPATVTIPANQPSVSFDIDAVDDADNDGTQTAVVTATASGYPSASDSLDVLDDESLTLMFTVDSIAENAGASGMTATVTRSVFGLSSSLDVLLFSSDTTEISLPTSVTIPANQSSLTFNVDVVDDQLLDGDQTVTATAQAAGFGDGTDTVIVTDHETLTLSISDEVIPENGGAGAATATVTRSNTDIGQSLTVTIANSDSTEATTPQAVTIEANQASAEFSIDAVQDFLIDGDQTVSLTATSGGYESGTDTVVVSDVLESPSILQTTRDNTLYEAAAADDVSSNGAGDHFFVGRTGGGDTRRGLIAFDVRASIPDGSTIVSATLNLHMSRTSNGSQSVAIHRATADWGEGVSDAPGSEGAGTDASPGDATWFHRSFDSLLWSAAGGDFANNPSAVTAVSVIGDYAWTSLDLTLDVQDWLDNPQTNFGWALVGNETQASTAKRFDTHENPNADVRPQLVLTFVVSNEPPTDVLVSNQMIDENTDTQNPVAVGTLTAVDADPDDSHVFNLVNGAGDSDNGKFLIAGNTLQIAAGTNLDHETQEAYSIRVQAKDQGRLTFEKILSIDVNDLNEIPTLDNPIPDQTTEPLQAFDFQFDAATFSDVDDGDVLTYSADGTTGSLPAWLDFDGPTRTFSGTPAADDVGDVEVVVTATDLGGLNVSDSLIISVESPFPWQNPVDRLDVDNNSAITPRDVLFIFNHLNANPGQPQLPPAPAKPPPYLDTNGDNFVTPLDALLPINFLNGSGGGGEGLADPQSGLPQRPLGSGEFATPERPAQITAPRALPDATRATQLDTGIDEVASSFEREPRHGGQTSAEWQDLDEWLESLANDVAQQWTGRRW